MASTVGSSSRKQLPSAVADADRPRVARVSAGFTLVELLIVIAVISLLAAVLFPVFARVREKAWQSACLSNLKQIGYAFQMYLDDWDDAYPWGCFVLGDAPGDPWPWQLSLLPYLRSVEVLACPTNPYRWDYPVYRSRIGGCSWPVIIPLSYGMNGYAFVYDNLLAKKRREEGGNPDFNVYSSDVKKPEAFIVVGETRQLGGVLWPYDVFAVEQQFAGAWDPPLAPWQGRLHSHLGRVNFLFANWNAKPMRVIDTFEPENMWAIRDPKPFIPPHRIPLIAPEYW